jgi:hypothetical protein
MEAARLNHAIYLYGFVPPDTVLPTNGLSGTADATVELLSYGAFSAALARVPADEYDPAVIEERFQDLPWVATQGVAHERVVAWFVDHAQIVPVPLFTLYSSEEALRAEVAKRSDAIVSRLARLAGLREWDMKIAYRPAEVEAHAAQLSPDIAALDKEIALAAPGRRFLLDRKRADMLKSEVTRAASRAANDLIDLVRPLVRDVKLAPLAAVAGELPVITNAALLVPADAEQPVRDMVRAKADELRALGIEVIYSGPWAPYRFVDNDQ